MATNRTSQYNAKIRIVVAHSADIDFYTRSEWGRSHKVWLPPLLPALIFTVIMCIIHTHMCELSSIHCLVNGVHSMYTVFRCVTRRGGRKFSSMCFVHGITAFRSPKTIVCDPMEKWLDSFYGLTRAWNIWAIIIFSSSICGHFVIYARATFIQERTHIS